MPFDTEQTFEKTDKTGDADPAMQRKVVSIVGPTASGKTGLGIAVAKALARKLVHILYQSICIVC